MIDESTIDETVSAHYAAHSMSSASITDFIADETSTLHRFIRLNPRFDLSTTLSLLSPLNPIRVPWLPASTNFYAIPATANLSTNELYLSGKIYGMDCSSGAAIAALSLPSPPSSTPIRVLDLCCCPGAKLCMVVDALLGHEAVHVVGVDVSETRLNVSKKILRKYIHPPSPTPPPASPIVQLYHGDGTTFTSNGLDSSTPATANPCTLVFDTRALTTEENHQTGRVKMNKSAKAREAKHLRHLSTTPPHPDTLFDFVLVDAECSTDGALTHLKHRSKGGTSAASEHVNMLKVGEQEEKEVTALQYSLLVNGFRQLKVGGVLVYATCSLSTFQNEDVITRFLTAHPTATLTPVPNLATAPSIPGSVEFTLRFMPTITGEEFKGSGFFIARITKTGI